jgi:hypothetical protein
MYIITNISASNSNSAQLDRLVGLAMLTVATTVFSYYTIWTLLMVEYSKVHQLNNG